MINLFNIEEELKKLPNKPGVYIMHDKDDNIIYVDDKDSLKEQKKFINDNFANGEKEVLDNFKELLDILKPQYVICLGRLVSEKVAKIYGQESRIRNAKNYNVFLDEELNAENTVQVEKS